jgi:hypothetical protein
MRHRSQAIEAVLLAAIIMTLIAMARYVAMIAGAAA